MPRGPQVRAAGSRLGADRVGRVGVTGQLTVGADRGGPLLPVPAGRGIIRDRAQGGDRPRQHADGGVLADPLLALVHGGGELSEVGAAFCIAGVRDLRGPRGRGEGDEGAGWCR